MTVNGRLTEVNEPAVPSARASRSMRRSVAHVFGWTDHVVVIAARYSRRREIGLSYY